MTRPRESLQSHGAAAPGLAQPVAPRFRRSAIGDNTLTDQQAWPFAAAGSRPSRLAQAFLLALGGYVINGLIAVSCMIILDADA